MLFQLFDSKPNPPGTLCPEVIRTKHVKGVRLEESRFLDEFLADNGLWNRSTPFKLHLGCGQKVFEGYVNIDYPSENHSVMSDIQADVFTDILTMRCNPRTISEIRLHHVFEHFNRVTALAQLYRWSRWLKDNGRLIIETPDLEGMAKTFLKTRDHGIRMGIVRHIAGDQSSPWGYHLEHWWPDRYVKTLEMIGYRIEAVASERWERSPFLSNVVIVAIKTRTIESDELRKSLYEILRESMIDATEQKTFEVWKGQLDDLLSKEGEARS